MLMRHHVAATHGSNEQGEYCSSGFAVFSHLNRDINYLLYFTLMRGRLYSSCVRSSMLHGSETWPIRKMRWHFSGQR